MSGQRPSESHRRDIVERNIRKEIDHERSKGNKPDVRKIEQSWREVARSEDRKRGWE